MAEATISYSEKESFGDADLIVYLEEDADMKLIIAQIQEKFNPKEIVNNNPTVSFDYKELQVDLIITKPANWETSIAYFSYNDLHNFIGKIAHLFGLKWGYDGLKKRLLLSNGKYLGDIYLSKNVEESLTFLGYDYKRYLQGFETYQDIVNYAISSKYFNKHFFLLENLNRTNRDRDKRRKNYILFLEWLETQDIKDYPYFENTDAYLSKISDAFPKFFDEYNALIYKEKRFESNRIKFNFNILMKEYPDLDVKEVGLILRNFRYEFPSNEQFEEFIYNNSIEDILIRINGKV